MGETVQQQIIFSQKEMQAQLAYWLDKLSGELKTLELPVDHPQLDLTTVRKEAIPIQVSEKLANRLLAISQSSDLNLYTILLAGLQGLLARITQAEETYIGSPLLDQIKGQKQYNQLVLLRQPLTGQQTLKDVVIQTKQNLKEAYKHQDYPLQLIIQELGLEVAEYLPALAKVILVLENMHTLDDVLDLPAQLILTFKQEAGGLQGQLIYAADLFAPETVTGFLESYLLFMEKGLEDLNQEIRSLPILTEATLARLLNTYNATEANYPTQKTIPQLFEEQVARTPERVALRCAEAELTYRELNQRANQLARKLRAMGVQPEKIVGLLVGRSIEMVVSILAVVKAGGAYLPMDRDYPEERIQYMLEDSRAELLLTEGEMGDQLTFGGEVLRVDDPALYQGDGTDLELVNSLEDLLYIIYTSGSTGRPKGVMIEQRNLVRLLFNDQFQFDFTENDVWTMFHSYCFDFSVWEMYGALLFGARLVVIAKGLAQSPADYLALLKQEGVTVLNQTPTAFYQLAAAELQQPDQQLQLRYVIFGGEALKPLLLKGWQEKYPQTKLINMYGITETTVHVTYKEITQAEIAANQSNIGLPIPTLTTYIMDANLNLLPMGVTGELCVGGAGVARGYLNRPELTAEKFVANPYRPEERLYRSGDLARRLANGELEYVGRLDHQVKIRGFRIELGEIEDQLLRQPAIKEAIVLVREENLTAYVVTDHDLSVIELREELGKVLPEYMIPAYFVCLDQLPMTANGKVDRRALPDVKDHLQTGVEYVPPETELQRRMVEIWSETLELHQIGIRDNFFHLGGDSIIAIRLVSLMKEGLKRQLKIADLYRYQTIAELSTFVATAPELAEQEVTLAEARQKVATLKEEILADLDRDGELDGVNRLPKDWVDLYPMSDIEQGMLFYTLKNPEQALYHDQFIYQIKDRQFDLARLEQALALLVQKHPILRTSFHLVDFAEPIQIVRREVPIEVQWADLTQLSRKEQGEYVAQYLAEDRAHPFEMTQAPLWRAGFCQLDQETVCMIWVVHHAIMDGWSLASFLTELFKTYQRLAAEPAYRPDSLLASYKDLVIEQIMEKDNPEALDYWQGELADYKRLKLPLTPEALKNSQGNDSYHRLLADSFFREVKQVAENNQTTVKQLCFAAYLYMLNMISYDDDFVVGMVTNTRPLVTEGDQILGCFLNTVPVRVQFSELERWGDLLHWVNSKVEVLKFYERVPFMQIVNWLGESTEDGNPFFDTIFNFVDFHVHGEAAELQQMNLDQSLVVKDHANTNTYFDLTVSTTLDRLKISFNYRDTLFTQGEVSQLADYFVAVLNAFIHNLDGQIAKNQILSDEAKELLLDKFNQTQVEYPKDRNITERFQHQVAESPEEVAVVYQGASLTYGELQREVSKLAERLREKGVQPGHIIGLKVERSLEMVIGILGILEAGAAFLPIDPAYPEERIRYLLADSQAKGLLTESLAELELWETDFADPELAYIIYTSGSTGQPKGVGIGHAALLNYVDWFVSTAEVGSQDASVFLSSYAFDLGYTAFWSTLLTGGRLHLIPEELAKDPEGIIGYLGEHHISFIKTTPSFFNLLVHSPEFTAKPVLAKLRLVVLGGEAIRVPDLFRYQAQYPKVQFMNHYGPTESTIGCISQLIAGEQLPEFATRPVIGRPNHNLRAYIVDQKEQLVPVGVMGELCIAGAGLAKGYLHRPELTAERFVEHPMLPGERMYKTGDLARWLPDGTIEFFGRIDHQVKVRGYRVELAEIEKQLVNEKPITEAVVVAKTDAAGRTYLSAYFVADEELDLVQVREALAKRLPEYMIPAYFLQLAKFPLTPNGKIDQRQLPEIQEQLDLKVEYRAPETEVEGVLAQVWAEVLGVAEVGTQDNFFLLGGDSIKAIQIISRTLRYQLKVDLKDLFAHPTIAELAPWVKQVKCRAEQGLITGEVGLTPIQHYFFEKTQTDRQHYNHAVMVYSPDGFATEIVEQVFTKIIEHHDALRMVFQEADGQIIQRNRGLEGDLFTLEVFQCAEADREYIETQANRLQTSIDLATGPLVKLGLFKTSAGDHLLMIVHHLVMDGISWRIIFEDFATGYRQALQGAEILFPEKTDSFKDWSKGLQAYAESKEMHREVAYWREIAEADIPPLPRDHQLLKDQLSSSHSIQVTLSVEDTQRLLKEANQVYNTQINDLLLTALGLAIQSWSGAEQIAVALEGHGREEIIEELNISRTIGWFTTVYPVIVDSSHPQDLGYQIKSVKENLRRIPHKGIGYGILKYLTRSEDTQPIDFQVHPEICLNYLGQFDQELRGSSEVFQISELPTGQARSPRSERKYVLDLIGMVREDQLTISFGYNQSQYQEATIHRLASLYQESLVKIIQHCTQAEQELTPSDVGYEQMSLEDFEYVSEVLDSLDLSID